MSIGGVLSNLTNRLPQSKFSAPGKNNPNVLSNSRFTQINTIYSQCFVYLQPTTNLLEMSNRACLIECEEKINGFIRELKITDEFYLQLHTHHQIRAIESVPARNRILHIGAREQLIQLPDGLYTQGENSKVVNYFFLMNDLTQCSSRKESQKENQKESLKETYKTLISEVATTAPHSVYRMVSMLENIGKDYVKIFKNSRLSFRLVVTDMTWSVIESVIEILNNNEGVENYAERVFKIANIEADPNESDFSWLCACPKILYFKLAKSVAQFKENIRTYSFLCLNKLASCTDLSSFDYVLKKTLIFFLSKRQTNQWIETCNFFEIFSELIEANDYKLFMCGNLKYIGYSQLIFDEIENTKTREMKRRLRNDSSFARHFKQLINSIVFEKAEPDMDENVFYCPELVDILLYEFIPYAFIWAGFVHRDLPEKANDIEILSNSPIDTFVRARLSLNENIIPVFPDEYIKKTYKYTLELSANC